MIRARTVGSRNAANSSRMIVAVAVRMMIAVFTLREDTRRGTLGDAERRIKEIARLTTEYISCFTRSRGLNNGCMWLLAHQRAGPESLVVSFRRKRGYGTE